TVDFERPVMRLLTREPGLTITFPTWSPDETWVYFNGEREGLWSILRRRADFGGPVEKVMSFERGAIFPCDISPDGKYLLCQRVEAGNVAAATVLLVPFEAPQKITNLFTGVWATLSPNGSWVAYVSWESGTPQLYVRPFQRPGPVQQISKESGYYGCWSPTGN